MTLTWTCAAAKCAALHRNGTLHGPTFDSSFPDVLNTSGGTFVYRVCERGTTNCSSTASVTF